MRAQVIESLTGRGTLIPLLALLSVGVLVFTFATRMARRAGGVAHPALTDAEPGGEREATVHREHLPRIATQPAERAAEPRRRRGGALLNPPRASPEAAGGVPERPQPVVEQPHPHAGSGPLLEALGELPTDRVLVEDVPLEGSSAAPPRSPPATPGSSRPASLSRRTLLPGTNGAATIREKASAAVIRQEADDPAPCVISRPRSRSRCPAVPR